jgi:hypothetical protein
MGSETKVAEEELLPPFEGVPASLLIDFHIARLRFWIAVRRFHLDEF